MAVVNERPLAVSLGLGAIMPGAALDLVFGKIERPKFCAGERYRLVKSSNALRLTTHYGSDARLSTSRLRFDASH
jgi:hypothetical protein